MIAVNYIAVCNFSPVYNLILDQTAFHFAVDSSWISEVYNEVKQKLTLECGEVRALEIAITQRDPNHIYHNGSHQVYHSRLDIQGFTKSIVDNCKRIYACGKCVVNLSMEPSISNGKIGVLCRFNVCSPK